MMATLSNIILRQIFGLILHGPAFGLSANGHRAFCNSSWPVLLIFRSLGPKVGS